MLKGTAREVAAELLGTFVLIVFGLGSVAQGVLSQNINLLSINIAWGLAVMMGIYVAGGISGAHLNPAVTIALAIHKKFPVKKVIPFIIAQFIGAFIGSLVVFLTYLEAMNHFDGGTRHILGPLGTAGIFATYPQSFLSTFPGGFIDQIVGTFLLMLLICALTDEKNSAPKGPFTAILVGGAVLLIGTTFGFNAGYAINPARDLAPRIFTALFGWGWDVFKVANTWWWVPVVAPCIGATLGVSAYEILIAKHHPKTSPH